MSDEPNTTLDEILARRRRQQRLVQALIAVAVVGAAAAAYLGGWGRGAAPEPTPAPAPKVAEVEPAPAAPAAAVEPELPAVPAEPDPSAEPLPPLAESDSRVRAVVARLSSRPELIAWLASDELIRRVVAAVDAVARGESPADQAPASMRPQGRFEVVAAGAVQIAAPAAAARYDLLTEVLLGLDADALVRAYRELRPLFVEAHRDLGSPVASFDGAVRRAIAELLAAPNVSGAPPLEPLQPGYGYVDPALEGLSAAKKQLLRFGPGNVSRLQQKLREVALRLGIPESELPRTPAYAVPAGGEVEGVTAPAGETPAAEAAGANP